MGGGKTKADADRFKSKFEQDDALKSCINGTVTILFSDNIKGLNSGFYIATIGCECVNFKTRIMLQLVRQYQSQIYIRKITFMNKHVIMKVLLLK